MTGNARARPSGRLVAGIAAAGVVVLLLGYWAATSFVDLCLDALERSLENELAASVEKEREAPSVFDVRLGRSLGERRQVTGTVRNNGPRMIKFVKLRCALLRRRTGRELDADTVYAVGGEGLPPGEQRDFDLYLDGSRAGDINHQARCEIVSYR